MSVRETTVVLMAGDQVLKTKLVAFNPAETVKEFKDRLVKDQIIDSAFYLIFAGRNLSLEKRMESIKLSQFSFIIASETPGKPHPDDLYPLNVGKQ